MKRIKNLFILSVLTTLSFFLNSCSSSTTITTLRPEPDNAAPLVYEKTSSAINLPIEIKLKSIENKANALLGDLIYSDTNIEDDNIEIKIWKTAPINILNSSTTNANKIKIVLPLKASIKYRFGIKQMGIDLTNTKEFNLNGVITLVSEINLVNWKLNTKTKLESLDWKESPTVSILGKDMPITYLINSSITLFKSKVERIIDDAIEPSLDFKPAVLSALEKINAPFLMNEQYESWLSVTPNTIYTTNIKLKDQSLLLDMGLKCTFETRLGKKPDTKFNANSIALKQENQISKQFEVNVMAVSKYQDASKIITKNFVGQEFGDGNKKVKIQKVDLWHSNGKMVVALDLLGALNGTIYLTGLPKYNETAKEIYFDELDYALETKDKLMKTANWFFKGLVLKKIQENCRYSIQSNLEEGKKGMMTYLKNYSPVPGIFINGKIENIEFKRIQLTNQAIIATLQINGIAAITINSL